MMLWLSLGVAIALALCYVLCMEVLARKSRETDSLVDYNRISPWRGDEDKS